MRVCVCACVCVWSLVLITVSRLGKGGMEGNVMNDVVNLAGSMDGPLRGILCIIYIWQGQVDAGGAQ